MTLIDGFLTYEFFKACFEGFQGNRIISLAQKKCPLTA